jgi:hypothetical protein
VAEEVRRCEHRDSGAVNPECTRRAVYRVSRPTRKHDAQDSCRLHLAATVDALSQGDTSLMLTISYVTTVAG